MGQGGQGGRHQSELRTQKTSRWTANLRRITGNGMTIFLDEATVMQLVSIEDALEAIEEVFREAGNGNVTNVPRVRVPLNDGTLRITAAVLSYRGYYGVKVSSTTIFGHNGGRVFSLYAEKSGELCAIVQVFALGALRTGAASGVATRYLSNPDSSVLGVIGSGRQARTQVDAIAAVRAIKEVRAFSRNSEKRAKFCQDIKARLGIDAKPVEVAQEAVACCDIVVTSTTSTTPVLLGEWLSPGTHINAIGANYEHRRELDSLAVRRARFIATDDTDQVRYESTDLAAPVDEGLLDWNRVAPLGSVVAGRMKGRAAKEDITLFKSLGIAIEDVALAARAYEKALKLGVGERLPDLSG
jgi:ornithine cyclodeaminase/alanine dehydrogenase-like protein (mu-crystallin family)